MTNILTKKHSEMYAGNLKILTKTAHVAFNNGKSYLVAPISKKIRVISVRFACGNVAGTDSAHSTIAVYKGTLAAIVAASAAGNLTDLTSIATKTFAAALAKGAEVDLTITATSADRDVDGAENAPVGLCFYGVSPGVSDAIPAGTWIVEYVDRDEE